MAARKARKPKHQKSEYPTLPGQLGYLNSYYCPVCGKHLFSAYDKDMKKDREDGYYFHVSNDFNYSDLIRTPMKDISEFLLDNDEVPPVYDVTQPSVYSVIGEKGIRRATVIKDFAYTITTRQDRTPAQVIDCGNGRYRYLTERECWRLQGYTDEDYERAKAVQKRSGRYRMALYKQAGNSIAVPIFESMFRKIILHETA